MVDDVLHVVEKNILKRFLLTLCHTAWLGSERSDERPGPEALLFSALFFPVPFFLPARRCSSSSSPAAHRPTAAQWGLAGALPARPLSSHESVSRMRWPPSSPPPPTVAMVMGAPAPTWPNLHQDTNAALPPFPPPGCPASLIPQKTPSKPARVRAEERGRRGRPPPPSSEP